MLFAIGFLVVGLGIACNSAIPSAETSPIVAQVPFIDGERLTYELVDVDGILIGQGELSAHLMGSRFVLTQNYKSVSSEVSTPATDVTDLAVDSTTLVPFGALREARSLNHDDEQERHVWEWGYSKEEDGELLTVTSIANGVNDRDELELQRNYYDNESSLWLWRTLEFNEELDLNYVSVNPIEHTQQTVNIQTPAIETVEVPAGTFEAWRLIVRNGRAIRSAWINIEPPHQIVQWDNGDVIFRLVGYE